jgi:hypothetical protein
MVGFNLNTLKQKIMQKNIKLFLKLFFVIIAPLVTVIYYLTYIPDILSEGVQTTVVCTLALALVLFNAIFYIVYMTKIKLFKRWTITLFKGIGFLISLDDDEMLVIIIGCFGITFTYKKIFSK